MPAPNSFVWYELMTTDLDAAAAFYRAVVGWSAEDAGQPDMRYTIMSAGDSMVAGMMTIPPEVSQAGGPPAWLGYIGTPDVDAATANVKRAGGAVHRPPDDIPGIGRFSVVADPQGAVFMLFTPEGVILHRLHRERPAMSAGTSFMPPTGRRRSSFTPGSSAGPRMKPSIWARWAPTSSSRQAGSRSAAS